MSEVLVIVPAREGSKGVPGKNLRPLGGVPLIGHVICSAQACTSDLRLIVFTDCPEIAAEGKR